MVLSGEESVDFPVWDSTEGEEEEEKGVEGVEGEVRMVGEGEETEEIGEVEGDVSTVFWDEEKVSDCIVGRVPSAMLELPVDDPDAACVLEPKIVVVIVVEGVTEAEPEEVSKLCAQKQVNT